MGVEQRLVQERVPHGPSVDDQRDRVAVAPGELRRGDEPDTVTPLRVPRTSSIFEACSKPRIAPKPVSERAGAARSARACRCGSAEMDRRVRERDGLHESQRLASSAWALFRNLRRAGVLKKRSWARQWCPVRAATSSFSATAPPSPRTSVPVSEPRSQRVRKPRDGADGGQRLASEPECPAMLPGRCRGELGRSRVASAPGHLVGGHPDPVVAHPDELPARSFEVHRDGRAVGVGWRSRPSSFTTEAGRSTTSPAAILFDEMIRQATDARHTRGRSRCCQSARS